MYVVYRNPDELYHHGVKGMKWGVRRFQTEDGTLTAAGRKRYTNDVSEKKAAYKAANKEYKKAFNKASNKAFAAYSPSKKHRQANDARWEDAATKAEKANKAQAEYKQAKKTRKQAIEQTTKKLNKQADLSDKLLYNNATRKKAAKYIVDNNMTVEAATAKANSDARRNTAIFLGAYGAIAIGSVLYNSTR